MCKCHSFPTSLWRLSAHHSKQYKVRDTVELRQSDAVSIPMLRILGKAIELAWIVRCLACRTCLVFLGLLGLLLLVWMAWLTWLAWFTWLAWIL